MADGKPSRPKSPGTSKAPPAPKGIAAKINHEVGIGPLKLPLWGWGAVALGAWWLWFHVIQPYTAAQASASDTTDSGYGGENLGSGSGGGGGGGQTGAATPPHKHPGNKHPHQHSGGHGQHHHQDHRPKPKMPAHHGGAAGHGGAGLPRHRPQRSSR